MARGSRKIEQGWGTILGINILIEKRVQYTGDFPEGSGTLQKCLALG